MSSIVQESGASDALKRRITHVTNLPTLPAVALRIVEMARNPDVGLAEVADVIALDPALAGKVLRLANSPLYSRQRTIDNVRQALVLFGLDGALTVALSFSVAWLVEDSKSESGLDYTHFWRRSLATAAAAPLIATRKGVMRLEDLFLAGLIQDIGILALDRVDPEFYGRIGDAQYDHAVLMDRELEMLGIQHGEVSAWMLERWNFPATIVDMVRGSHADSGTLSAEDPVEVRILHVAAVLADAWWHSDREKSIAGFAAEAERLLELPPDEILEIIEAFAPEILNLSEIMEADLGDPVMLASITEEARELLMLRNLHSLQQTQEMERKAQHLEEKASTDPLTGAGNRGYFDEILEAEFETACRHGWPLSMMLIDLDHFKKVNDQYGHQAGDKVLQEVVDRIWGCLRKSDTLARYGGEEFAVILPGTRLEGARVVAQRILDALRKEPVDIGNGISIPVTASLGLLTMEGGKGFPHQRDFLRAVDRALYEAKHQGRDRAVEYDVAFDQAS